MIQVGSSATRVTDEPLRMAQSPETLRVDINVVAAGQRERADVAGTGLEVREVPTIGGHACVLAAKHSRRYLRREGDVEGTESGR